MATGREGYVYDITFYIGNKDAEMSEIGWRSISLCKGPSKVNPTYNAFVDLVVIKGDEPSGFDWHDTGDDLTAPDMPYIVEELGTLEYIEQEHPEWLI